MWGRGLIGIGIVRIGSLFIMILREYYLLLVCLFLLVCVSYHALHLSHLRDVFKKKADTDNLKTQSPLLSTL